MKRSQINSTFSYVEIYRGTFKWTLRFTFSRLYFVTTMYLNSLTRKFRWAEIQVRRLPTYDFL